MQLQDTPEHMARCQQTNTYHTRHICTLAAQDNVWGYNKQISRRSTSATDTTVLLIVSVLHREYINNFVCKRLRLFLTYTVPIISSGETSWSQHIMAQSVATKLPLVHPAEAPAQTSTSINTIHRNPVTPPKEVQINVFLPLNPVLTILPDPPRSGACSHGHSIRFQPRLTDSPRQRQRRHGR